MGGGGKPGKIVPMLTEIIGRLKDHNVVTVHFASSTFKTMKHLDELKKLCETPNAVTQGIDEVKISIDKRHDVLMKELKGLKETTPGSRYRTFVDAVGDWTPLKAFNVGSDYVAAFSMIGGTYLFSYLDKEKKLERKMGEVKIGFCKVGEKLLTTHSPNEPLAMSELYWPY